MHCDVDFVICQVKQGDGWGGRYDKGVERCSAVLGMLIRVMALGEQRIVAGPAFEAQPKAAEGPVHCDLGNPIPWPEHRPAHRRVDCTTFGLGDHGRFVWGEGDPTSRLMFVLDNPGAREDKEGASFVCGTRRTLRKAMEEAGLPPDAVYITYLIKCRPLRAYDKPGARAVGAGVLREQVAEAEPRSLVLFGDVVVQTLVGADVSVRTLRGMNLKVFHIDTVATYHPLAARRRPNLYPLLVEDLRRVQHVSKARYPG